MYYYIYKHNDQFVNNVVSSLVSLLGEGEGAVSHRGGGPHSTEGRGGEAKGEILFC